MSYTGDIIRDKQALWDGFATKYELRNFYILSYYCPQLRSGKYLQIATTDIVETIAANTVNDYDAIASQVYSTKAEVCKILCVYILT